MHGPNEPVFAKSGTDSTIRTLNCATLQARIASFTLNAVWNVNERFSQKAIESLAALGFGVGSTRGVVRVEKIRVWRGVPQGCGWLVSDDRAADHHAEWEVHAAVGCGIPEIFC